MKGDAIIKLYIEKALTLDRMFSEGVIVEVSDGNALLTGYVDKYPKKTLAKKIAKEVQGVKSITEKIAVKLNDSDKSSDRQIESDITERFMKNFGSSYKDIIIVVREGNVLLEGQLKWKYQKDLAEECIFDVKGITGIENNILIPERPKSGINEKDVFASIYGNPSITTEIQVEILGNRVILKGKVHNIEQKNLVTRLVRNVPGVQEVENFLTIERML